MIISKKKKINDVTLKEIEKIYKKKRNFMWKGWSFHSQTEPLTIRYQVIYLNRERIIIIINYIFEKERLIEDIKVCQETYLKRVIRKLKVSNESPSLHSLNPSAAND